VTGGNIKECNFVSALLVVAPGYFHRITGIANIDKLHTFDHAPFVYI
jgi:hypothetical protein